MAEKVEKTLGYFLRKSEEKIVDYPAPPSFVDDNGERINLKFRILKEEERLAIIERHKTKKIALNPKTKQPIVVNGSIVYDIDNNSDGAVKEMVATSLVQPNLTEDAVQDYYNCCDKSQLLLKIFSTRQEYEYVLNAFYTVHGFITSDGIEDDTATSESDGDFEDAKN